MAHNLQYQLKSAIDKSFKEGVDKHAYKRSEGFKATSKVFSYASRKDLIQTSANFAKYIKNEYPEVRKAYQITSEHVNRYLESKQSSCSSRTIEQYAARLEKLQLIVNDQYKSANVSWDIKIPEVEEVKVRDVSFNREHFNEIMNYKENNCQSYKVLDVCERFGLRVQEAVKITAGDINYERKTITVTGKGGKVRELPFKSGDANRLREYSQHCYSSNSRLFTVQPDTVNKYLKDACHQLGIRDYDHAKTGIHAIRKMVAQERYDEQRKLGATKEQALTYVNDYLGHGDHRPDISDTYVKNQW